jgi:23S rRNA (cytosine1962-C5)-methyltransferase
VSEADFAEVIAAAAIDAHADIAVVEKRMQARDHPVLMTVPETYYLKCFIVRKLE